MNRAERRRQRKQAEKTAKTSSSLQSTNPATASQQQAIQQTLNSAMQHHTAGRLAEADGLYRQVLQTDSNQPVAMHLLGVIAHQVGDDEVAVDLISKAIDIEPDYAEAHNNLGLALQALGRSDDAATSYRKAITIKPGFAEAFNNLGNALRNLGKPDDAVTQYRQAISLNAGYAEAHNNLGFALHDMGAFDEAVTSFRKAIALKPEYAEAHFNIGNALKSAGELTEAIASYRTAISIKPNYADAYNNLGNAFQDLEELDDATASYEQAISVMPDFAEAHNNLCEVLEMTNATEALRDAVTRARHNCPDDPSLALAQAQLLKRDGDYAAARTILEAMGPDVTVAGVPEARAYLLGELCDRLGDADAAYKFFSEGNRLSRQSPDGQRVDGKNYVTQIDRLAKRFTSDWVKDWQPAKSTDGRADPVFLVGFPRSGTTLLDTILRSHHAINVVEEMPIVQHARAALDQFSGGYPDGLANLDSAQLTELRQVYFAELDKHLETDTPSHIVVDKLPLNAIDAGFIHRIFPNARFVFALRHPCDCVLSCFMQNFEINEAMANFLDLKDAAQLYDKVMTLWQHYQTVLPLQVHTIRYETLIEAFEETLTPLLEFLDVGWDEGVRDYAETAHRRRKIATPSYNQVTQPLYTRARGRWERYREQMQPVLPTLLTWAKTFDYDE